MRWVLWILILVRFSFGSSYNDAIEVFRSDFVEEFDKTKVLRTIQENRKFAISSYIALKSASYLYLSGKTEEAKEFLKLVDERAIMKEDMPFFLYIKLLAEENGKGDTIKRVVLNYPDSYYGYKLFVENHNLFREEEKVEIIESLIKKKMRERATFLLFTLSEPDSISYIRLMLSTSARERKEVFESIPQNSKYYQKALKYMAEVDREYEERFLSNISDRQEYEKSVLHFATRSFYRGEDISKYILLIPESSPNLASIKWLEFLSAYRERNYLRALEILQTYQSMFEKDTVNYWFYLLYRKIGDLQMAQEYISALRKEIPKEPSEISFYRALLDFKERRFYNFRKNNHKPKDEELTRILLSLKRKEYRLAYIESVYLTKNGICNEVYNAVSEVGVRCFDRNSVYTYVKPFGKVEGIDENLVYSIIRQESFFDPFAVSISNAVGITQFIPKTANQFAKKLSIDNFDITHLFNPELAIKFGVEYLKYLDKLWNGNIVYMVASYNAGENAVKKFLDNNKVEDPGEFVELFPYRETRDYVKKVIKNYVVYKSLE